MLQRASEPVIPTRRRDRVIASPRARRAMRKKGLDPVCVPGSGPNGRIVEADVIHAEPSLGIAPPAPLATTGISPIRRAVAQKVTESFRDVPHFYLRAEADVTSLLMLRQQMIETVERTAGVRLSLTDLLLRAMILGFRDCRHANRIWQNDGIVELPTIDVGLVVMVGDGLLVPILHEADRLSLMELVRRRAELVDACRSGRVPAGMLQGGASALSNLGRHRVDEFAPIISPPHSSMLAVGRVAPRPTVFEDRLCIRQTLCLTLSVDHRVMDGDPAAEFLDRIVSYLERPFQLACEARQE